MFTFKRESEINFIGVHQDLIDVAKKALEISFNTCYIPFEITCGKRSGDEQRELVLSEASPSMDSRHTTGHAIDIVVYMAGRYRLDFSLYLQIAECFRQAAIKTSIPIVYGGSWMRLNDMENVEKSVIHYVKWKEATHSPIQIDFNHFELDRRVYKIEKD